MFMKGMVITGAALACALTSLAAFSADQTVPAAAGGKPAAKSGTQAAVREAAPPKRRSRATEDARHCLDAGDNTAIIRCAEKYL